MNYSNLTLNDINVLSNKRNWEILKYIYDKQMNTYFPLYSEVTNLSTYNVKELIEGLKELWNENYIMQIPIEEDDKETYVILTIKGINSFAIAENFLIH